MDFSLLLSFVSVFVVLILVGLLLCLLKASTLPINPEFKNLKPNIDQENRDQHDEQQFSGQSQYISSAGMVDRSDERSTHKFKREGWIRYVLLLSGTSAVLKTNTIHSFSSYKPRFLSLHLSGLAFKTLGLRNNDKALADHKVKDNFNEMGRSENHINIINNRNGLEPFHQASKPWEIFNVNKLFVALSLGCLMIFFHPTIVHHWAGNHGLQWGDFHTLCSVQNGKGSHNQTKNAMFKKEFLLETKYEKALQQTLDAQHYQSALFNCTAGASTPFPNSTVCSGKGAFSMLMTDYSTKSCTGRKSICVNARGASGLKLSTSISCYDYIVQIPCPNPGVPESNDKSVYLYSQLQSNNVRSTISNGNETSNYAGFNLSSATPPQEAARQEAIQFIKDFIYKVDVASNVYIAYQILFLFYTSPLQIFHASIVTRIKRGIVKMLRWHFVMLFLFIWTFIEYFQVVFVQVNLDVYFKNLFHDPCLLDEAFLSERVGVIYNTCSQLQNLLNQYSQAQDAIATQTSLILDSDFDLTCQGAHDNPESSSQNSTFMLFEMVRKCLRVNYNLTMMVESQVSLPFQGVYDDPCVNEQYKLSRYFSASSDDGAVFNILELMIGVGFLAQLMLKPVISNLILSMLRFIDPLCIFNGEYEYPVEALITSSNDNIPHLTTSNPNDVGTISSSIPLSKELESEIIFLLRLKEVFPLIWWAVMSLLVIGNLVFVGYSRYQSHSPLIEAIAFVVLSCLILGITAFLTSCAFPRVRRWLNFKSTLSGTASSFHQWWKKRTSSVDLLVKTEESQTPLGDDAETSPLTESLEMTGNLVISHVLFDSAFLNLEDSTVD